MNVKFQGEYKSLKDFEWLDIPQLAILTGLNGTGKTQLLYLISQYYQSLTHNTQFKNTYSINNTTKITIENVDFIKSGLLQWHSRGGHFSFEHNKFGFQDLKKICEFLINFVDPHKNPRFIDAEQKYLSDISQKINDGSGFVDPHPAYSRIFHTLNSSGKQIIEEVVQQSGKSIETLLPADIMMFFPIEIVTENSDLISQDSLDMIFYMYLYKKTSLIKNNKDISNLGEAPWEILNKVISASGIPYRIMTPEIEHIESVFGDPLNQLNPYQFSAKLIDPNNNQEIGIDNLSSGERVIMSLALLLYYFEYRGLKKSIIILDEIDAHLHPSLTKQFFDVIHNVVIKEYGARVIMATHSPSTVALAPSENLFVINKESNSTKIESVSKDKALSILTFGVPSLSISYQNRKQVFVESKYDAEFYDQAYSLLKRQVNPEISLNFISSGVSGRGNCDQVMDIVRRLNDFGNTTIFGIIDWDLKNSPISHIEVLGLCSRYSIENYIFDPVLLGYFLLREKFIQNEELGLDKEEKFLNFGSFDSFKLQVIADKILDKIKPKFKKSSDGSVREVEYINGIKLNLPVWFLENNGHDIADILISTFPQLQRFKEENRLRKEVLNKTISDIPDLISKDILDLFIRIQKE
ncbi:ATP-binding protein [Pedobacter sp. SD-b]|uniref:ATP-binding protein n=1 Tax=Pedobacter segetis TaxID=2793069 RepID=A0ABS1BKX2_9SPHI|nr:AAA family ATPase [Pedobacter segetis]MBK0382869.1 ATP-binding protein [Pedobacter segetis]